MKYCPDCEAEYHDDISLCADCNIPLVSEEEFRRLKGERDEITMDHFVDVYPLENVLEAKILENLLKDNGIEPFIQTFYETAFNGIFIPQKAWGVVRVLSRDKEKAKGVIEKYLRDKERVV